MCIQDKLLSGEEDQFRELHHMISSIFHFEFHKIIEALKDNYAVIDPDSDARQLPAFSAKVKLVNSDNNFVDLLGNLLEKANYERVTEEDLNQALNEASLFKIRLEVDFKDFDEVLLFSRGETTKQETVKSWFGLKSHTISFTNYERVVVYLRFKNDYQQIKGFEEGGVPGATLLKLFQNVPKADLEMLFPNTTVRMRLIDKLLIGVPALISGGIVVTTKLGASIILMGSLLGFWIGYSSQPVELNKAALMTLLAGIAALGGYLWKQFNSFKNRKLKFIQSLTKNLYFKNLDNNAGVFFRLANDAEEEECKEAILAYYFLLISKQPLTKSELDQQIEHWMSSKWQCSIDFEIEDALEKLLTLKLVEQYEDKLTAVSIRDGVELLDERWDDYFLPDRG
ncbi:MAG: DUF3754 domain-containing protein [Gammaproteobacteria bacterium]|nr:DUF3754 domain-containing protein [Gammaproteobacteria bacterium]